MSRHKSQPRQQPTGRRFVAIAGLGAGLVVCALAATASWPSSAPRAAVRGTSSSSGIAAASHAVAPSQTVSPAAPATSRRAEAPPVDQRDLVGPSAQQVHIDPRTRQIREGEHDDAVALRAAGAQRRTARLAGVETASEPQPIIGPEGAVGMAVPEELQMFVVATRLPDGRIVLEHATGPTDAKAKTRAGASQARRVPGKGEPNDR